MGAAGGYLAIAEDGMMSKAALRCAAVVACIAAVVAGCSDQSATQNAADVGGTAVSASQVRAWFGAFSPGIQLPSGRLDDDAMRNACRRASEKVGASTGAPELPSRGDCISSLKLARAEALGYLIRSVWLAREASRRGIVVTDEDFNRALAKRTRQLEAGGEFQHRLSSVGLTKAQFRRRVRRDELFRKLLVAAESPDDRVSKSSIRKFYRRHSSEFNRPATRYVSTVVTRSRARALQARAMLERGEPWRVVVGRYSIDGTQHRGGRAEVDTQNVIRNLRVAVFSSELGQIVGPIDVRGLWWVFRVDRHTPARRLSLAEVTPRIRISIRSTRVQFAIDRLTGSLARRYRPETICHNGYTAPECRNRSPVTPSQSGS